MSVFTRGKSWITPNNNEYIELLYQGEPVYLKDTQIQVYFYDEQLCVRTPYSRLQHPITKEYMLTSTRHIKPNELFHVMARGKVTVEDIQNSIIENIQDTMTIPVCPQKVFWLEIIVAILVGWLLAFVAMAVFQK